MRALFLAGAAALALTACGPGQENSEGGAAGGVLLMDGSSTVYPISEALVEEFQRASGTRITVGLSGTGGGFKKFCRGEVDITAASRPIEEDEATACAAEGIEFIELPVALDALSVLKHPSNTWAECLSVEELRRAWAPGAEGQISSWRQIRADFPDEPLKLFGPGVDSGTFDYFTEVVVGEARSSRSDYTATEDDNVIITGVATEPSSLGYTGLAYAMENAGRVGLISIRQPDGTCVTPSVEAARAGNYVPLSRPLFYYVSRQAADAKPYVADFVAFAFDPENAALVSEVGYVPMPEDAYARVRARFDNRVTGKAGAGVTALLRGEQAAASPGPAQ